MQHPRQSISRVARCAHEHRESSSLNWRNVARVMHTWIHVFFWHWKMLAKKFKVRNEPYMATLLYSFLRKSIIRIRPLFSLFFLLASLFFHRTANYFSPLPSLSLELVVVGCGLVAKGHLPRYWCRFHLVAAYITLLHIFQVLSKYRIVL
jgi:hypothetical protein